MNINSVFNQYRPKSVLIRYDKVETSGDHVFESQEKDTPACVLRIADVVKCEEGGYTLGAERDLTRDSLEPLKDYFISNAPSSSTTKKEFSSDLIPENIIAVNNAKNLVIWKRPAKKAKLYFSTSNKSLPDECEVMQPNLIFKLKGDVLSVWAYKSYKGEKTKIYMAPYLNVNASSVCMGSADIDKKVSSWEELVENAEFSFFNSLFSHYHSTSILTEKYEYSDLIAQLIKSGSDFPSDALFDIKKTLKDLL